MKFFWLAIIITVVSALIFTGLLYIGHLQYAEGNDTDALVFYESIDSRVYDLLLRLKPAIPEDPSILLLEVDDLTITEIDAYPLPREVFADGLILASEFAPAWVMLDIEFVDSSEDGINYEWLNQGIPAEVDQAIENLSKEQAKLVNLILDKKVTRQQALEYIGELEQANTNAADRIIASTRNITFSKDTYLGNALAYFGNVTATVNMVDDKDETITDELRQWTMDNVSINDYLTLYDDPFDDSLEILPAIPPVIQSAKWAGYPRSFIDIDGIRRRIDPIYRHGDRYYTNLGFGTWWVRAGKPPITVYPGRMEVGGLTIPLDQRGKVLINWPKRKFDGTPLNRREAQNYDPTNPEHRLSFFYLYYHDRLLEDLSIFIEDLERYGITSDVHGETNVPLSVMAGSIEALQKQMLAEGDGSKAVDLGGYRDEYIEKAWQFYNGDAESSILREVEQILDASALASDDYAYYTNLSDNLAYLFSETRVLLDDIRLYRDFLRTRLEGATIIAGYTGTSTTDYGANPFERKYMNMGIYGALYNSLVQGSFLRELPLGICLVINIIAGFAVALLTQISKKNSTINIISGATGILLIIIAGSLVFTVTNIYISMVPLMLTVLAVYIGTLVISFLSTSKEKAFIQNAFGQIISPDVVKRIQENPTILNMGGDNRPITAMFTDIEKFSTISEHLGSSDKLFEFIKRYLTPMSDIILEELGTIDKYEGDAIISFWNAPLNLEDHPIRACRAAMRMIHLEETINQQLIDEGLLDAEILSHLPHGKIYTRIGINTGVNNVGFIGTDQRKDYTALGDEMNLAARLEGVNKQYGTQVLISGSTNQFLQEEFLTRHLDKIRVMGKEKPVSCYELCHDENSDIEFPLVKRKSLELYGKAQEFFYEKRWDEAEKLFQEVIMNTPDDGPSKVFINRCQAYRKNPPPDNWGGVYRMETK